MTFDQQIFITLLDKGLLALLIVLVTFSVNIILEKYKSLAYRNNEILKIRITAMNTTWTKIYSWIAESNFKIANSNQTNMHKTIGDIIKSSEDVSKIIEENRFLCGEKFSDDCLKYFADFLNYYVNPNQITWGQDHYKGLRTRGESILSSLPKYLASLDQK